MFSAGGQRGGNGVSDIAQFGVAYLLTSEYSYIIAVLPKANAPSRVGVTIVADVTRFAGAIAGEKPISVGGRIDLPDFDAEHRARVVLVIAHCHLLETVDEKGVSLPIHKVIERVTVVKARLFGRLPTGNLARSGKKTDYSRLVLLTSRE